MCATQDPVYQTLEEAAQMRAQAVAEAARARQHFNSLKPEYEAASRALSLANDEIKRIDQAMGFVKRNHAINVALSEAGIEYGDARLLIARPGYSTYDFGLVAIGPEGTGLYLHVPEHSHRYQGRDHRILYEAANTHGVAPQASEWDLKRGGTRRLDSIERETGLIEWQHRGSGSYGAGSGSMKPKPPPEGGRWKWLKIDEQKALEGSVDG
jgi:hypothetical protein